MNGRAARVVVERPPEELGEQYPITVTLDGERIGRLRPRDSVERQVEPGPHRLSAFNTLFWKTVAFDVSVGSSIRFVTTNRENLLTNFSASIGFGFLSVVLEQR